MTTLSRADLVCQNVPNIAIAVHFLSIDCLPMYKNHSRPDEEKRMAIMIATTRVQIDLERGLFPSL
jgi:hypothetical protein